jgi:DNA-binding IclR family transcriptional regulator
MKASSSKTFADAMLARDLKVKAMARRQPKAGSSDLPEKGLHQNIARATLVLSALADAAHEGLRLSDVIRSTGLSNGTTHRLLEGLVEHGLADLKADSGRYFLGMKIFSWSKSASNRFGLAERVAPALQRLADRTNDTAYFMLRVDDDSLCLDCREGSFPIKTISVRVGNRWPLGVGAGGLSLLAFLPENEMAQIIRDHQGEREKFGIKEAVLKKEIANARKLGYAVVDGTVIPGMSALSVPINGKDQKPIGSITLAAITPRLIQPRRGEIVKLLLEEARSIEHALAN